MVLSPAIIALIAGSWLISAFAVYASVIGVQIIRRWDIQSGSEMQLALERKTYLISAILAYLFAFELFSLFLFAYTTDSLHAVFVGAMCAAGSLNVNAYGYPTLIMKIANFILCGIWLILNYTDNRGFDYPLIRTKYKFLVFITALLLVETIWQTGYFIHTRGDVITSCCGSIFGEDVRSIAGEIAALPPSITKILFYLSVVLMLRTGIHFYVTGRGARIFASLSNWLLVFSLVSIISFISLYFYELPTHHCPFCLLQREYHYIGYPLYLCLFAAGIMGASVGVIDRVGGPGSLKGVVPVLQKRLCLLSMVCYAAFAVISTYPMIFSDFKLEGY
jgi:hypothetical protein